MNTAISSVWRQLFDDPAVALDLELRAQLLMQLQALLAERQRQRGSYVRLIGSAYVTAIERGQLDKLSLDTLVRIAALLRCEINLELRSPIKAG